ncbi:hypothetical protein K502DRAFT_342067 [Neoconidiobolus thromboides FSU 785]|nr:hypothetical protein K502DRAFT_342067 [Neoconidiobolus thromboides FSU 785]
MLSQFNSLNFIEPTAAPSDGFLFDSYLNPTTNQFCDNTIALLSNEYPFIFDLPEVQSFRYEDFFKFDFDPTENNTFQEPNPFESTFGHFISSPSTSSPPQYLNTVKLEQNSGPNNVTKKIQMNKRNKRRKATKEETLVKNREAASKCRQKKKEWLKKKEVETRLLDDENDYLSEQVTELKNEILNLKMLLSAHNNNCNISLNSSA